MALLVEAKYVMYLTGQHNVVPEPALVSEITHVALAFMRPHIFNDLERTEFPLFTTVPEVRSKFAKKTSVMIAVGGWGDTEGFCVAAASNESRKLFAKNIKKMIDITGADGVDIDWEYPGGNGEDYKQVPNTLKSWEITAYPQLLSEIRLAIGPDKLISAAVPGLPRDMLAFTKATIPQISASIDFFNIMTYDMMNRRDNATNHHTGMQLSLQAIDAYLKNGLAPEKANLGFAFYAKWFRTRPRDASTPKTPVGRKTPLMEDPLTGADLGQGGGFSWHDGIPEEMKQSWRKAVLKGKYDQLGGGHYYQDDEENIWWTWDDPKAILKKFPQIVEWKGLGGVFAWGLGEDAPEWKHLRALNDGVKRWKGTEERNREL